MSWKWAAMMPHPPIIVPEVGLGRQLDAARTIEGMTRTAAKIAGAGSVDAILLLSPHQTFCPMHLAVNCSQTISGSFERFGVPFPTFEIEPVYEYIHSLADFLEEVRFPVLYCEDPDLSNDQGTMVPLYYIQQQLAEMPSVILSSPIGLHPDYSYDLGRALAGFDDGLDWGLLASGDLSHRLDPDGPNGFSEIGARFDENVVHALATGNPDALLDMTTEERDDVGECGLRSALVMIGLMNAIGGDRFGWAEICSYEAPFGVGYCTAFWRGSGLSLLDER